MKTFDFATLIFLLSVTVIFFIFVITTLEKVISISIDEINEIVVDKIDWHDWKLIENDKKRIGLGEHGIAAYLTKYPYVSKRMNDTYGYNGFLSEKIPLNRSICDLRPPK